MSEKIKVLFYGDSPSVATGFGTVSRNILRGLHGTGKYDIKCLAVNYWGDPHEEKFPQWPIGIGSKDPYGRQRAYDMMAKMEFDVLFMIQDSFILQSFMEQAMPKLRSLKDFVSVCYYPIDGVPKPEWINCMNMFDHPVAYTQFGKKESILACPEIASKLNTIPHGINTADFFPHSREESDAFKRAYFGKHGTKFIVTNLNRNQQRKDIPRTILAFKEFQKRRPNSALYLHMAAQDQGWNLPEVVRAAGLKLNEDVLLPGNGFGPNQGFPLNVVNNIYNASDVVMSMTLGEGWGLSSVEAMACKTPIIFPRNTSLEEIIGENEERGYFVSSGERPDSFIVLPNDNEVLRPLASIEEMADKLTHVYDNHEEAQVKAAAAYEWVTTELNWNKNIVPQWDKLISDAVVEWVKNKNSDTGVVSVEDL